MEKTKIFFDIEKEIEWLNQMSKQGYRLTDRKHFTYYFAECRKESYIYQVERRTFGKKKEYEDYKEFIASMNIRIAANQVSRKRDLNMKKKMTERNFKSVRIFHRK